MDIWAQPFRIKEEWMDLERLCLMCDFCQVRWNICKDLDLHKISEIYFDRSGSTIKVNGRYPPVLSVFQEPGM